MGVNKIRIFGNHDSLILFCKADHVTVRRAVLHGQIKGVQGVISCCLKRASEATRELGVDQKFHAITNSVRFTWLRRAA